MSDSGIHEAITGVIGAVTTVFGYFGMRLIKQVDLNTSDLSAHRIDDANKFATRADVMDSLGRLHDRIDTVSEDIKTLIGRR